MWNLLAGIINSGGVQRGARLDKSTHALMTIDYPHHETHAGSAFFIKDVSTGVAINEFIEFGIVTPSGDKHAHMLFSGGGTVDGVKFEVYEGATITGGTEITPLNSNRNSETVSVLSLSGGAVDQNIASAYGTRIEYHRAGANQSAGDVTRDQEIILKANTHYVFRFTSLGNGNYIDYSANWYEHTERDTAL
jgi:hypothetical protein